MNIEGSSRRKRRGRGKADLSTVLERLVSSYAMAATAGGVTVLALAAKADGKIVYTPADMNIPVNNHVFFVLDLNHDGIADFSFENVQYGGFGGLFVGCAAQFVGRSTYVCLDQSNMVWGRGVVNERFASALRRDFKVGPNKVLFQQGQGELPDAGPNALMGWWGVSQYSGSTTGGQWLFTKDRYLGLQFVIQGQVHYGWARVTVSLAPERKGGIYAVLTGYAYETEANKPIITGKTKGDDVVTLEPSTLGYLARGASGVRARQKP